MARGDWVSARTHGEASLAAWRELDDRDSVAEAVVQLALTAQRAGDRGGALRLARQGAALARDLEQSWPRAYALYALGEIALGQGNGASARKQFSECLILASKSGLSNLVIMALEGLAEVAAARGESQRALRLAGGADRLRQDLRMPLYSVHRELLQLRLGPTLATLHEESFAAAWALGHSMSSEELIRDALNADAPVPPVDADAAIAAEVKWLTPRERDVAGLVAEGLHNSEIAQRLRISPNTVEVHMSNILGKLGMASRAQLAVWATAHQLHRGQ
jgi:non-specific serine/threonine protein kinase